MLIFYILLTVAVFDEKILVNTNFMEGSYFETREACETELYTLLSKYDQTWMVSHGRDKYVYGSYVIGQKPDTAFVCKRIYVENYR